MSSESSTSTPAPNHPLGEAVETFLRREDAERFVEGVRGDEPELASYLRVEERELEAGGAELAILSPVSRKPWQGAHRAKRVRIPKPLPHSGA